jgi:hypothetical protein
MKSQITSLLETLKIRVMANLEIIHENEKKIRQVLSEPLSSDRSEKLKMHFNFSRQILLENSDILLIQKQLREFISKYNELPKYNEVLFPLHSQMSIESAENEPSESQRISNILDEINSINSQMGIRAEPENSNTEDKSSLFSRTIFGEIPYNSTHPLYNDEQFYNKLLNFYIAREEYEICAKIKRAKDL